MQDNSQTGPGPNRTDVPCLLALLVLTGLLYLPQFISGLSAMDCPENLDVTAQWYPAYTVVSRSYEQGLFPLWNPGRYGGMPWLAYSHTGGLYPFNVLLFTGLDFPDAATLSHFIHCLIAALGAFAFFRALRLSPCAAFMSSVVFSCSGFYFYMQSQLSNHATIAWTPLFLFVLSRIDIRPRLLLFLLLCIISAMMALAGDTEGLVYHFIFVVFFVLFVLRHRSAGPAFRSLFLFGCAFAAGVLMSAAMVTVLLELTVHSVRSPHSLFQLEFAGTFKRVHPYLPFLFFPWKYFGDIHSVADFNHGLAPFYLGSLPLFFGLYSLSLYRRDSRVASLWHMVLFMFALVVIKKTEFLEPYLAAVPVLGKLATPERSLELVQLAFLAAAGLGLDHYFSPCSRKRLLVLCATAAAWGIANLVMVRWLVGANTRFVFGALMVCFGITCLYMVGPGKSRVPLIRGLAVVVALVDVYLLALAAVPRTPRDSFELPQNIVKWVEKQDRNYRYIAFEKKGPGVEEGDLSGYIFAHTGLDSPWGRMRLPLHRYFEFLHLVNPEVAKDWGEVFVRIPFGGNRFFTLDLSSPVFLSGKNLHLLNLLSVRYVFSRGISFKFSSPFSLMNEESLVRGDWRAWPRRQGMEARFYRDRGRPALETGLPYRFEWESHVYPGTELAFEVKPPRQGPFPDRLQVRLLAGEAGAGGMDLVFSKSLMARRGEEAPLRVSLERFAGKNARLRLEIECGEPGTRAVILDVRFIREDAPFQRVVPGEIDIFINTNAFARAFIAHEARALPPDRIRELLASPERFDPARTLLFDESRVPENLVEWINRQPRPRPGMEAVRILDHGLQTVKIMCRTVSPGWLFLSDVDYPGWRAWVDGEETVIHRADYIFRALFLPKGDHSIRFQYRPISFRAGLWMSIASLLAACISGFAKARHGRC